MADLARCQFSGCQSAFSSVEDMDKHIIIEHTSADLNILQFYKRRAAQNVMKRPYTKRPLQSALRAPTGPTDNAVNKKVRFSYVSIIPSPSPSDNSDDNTDNRRRRRQWQIRSSSSPSPFDNRADNSSDNRTTPSPTPSDNWTDYRNFLRNELQFDTPTYDLSVVHKPNCNCQR